MALHLVHHDLSHAFALTDEQEEALRRVAGGDESERLRAAVSRCWCVVTGHSGTVLIFRSVAIFLGVLSRVKGDCHVGFQRLPQAA